MAGTRAEGDDEGFGDFTFASFSNYAVRADQINSQKSTAAADDDEWGDFVEYPPQSVLSDRLSSSNASGPSRPFDPFGFFPGHSTSPAQSAASPTESAPVHVRSEKAQWVKPKGALPLSLFGDVEQEEEESGAVDPPVGDTVASVRDKHADNVRNGSNMLMGSAFNDIIANLYSQSQEIKAESGLNSNSNRSNSNAVATDSNPNGVNSDIDGLISNSGGSNSNSELFTVNNGTQMQQIKTVSSLDSLSAMFSGNNDGHIPKIKDDSWLNSNSDLFSGSYMFSTNNGSQSPQVKDASVLSTNSDLFSGSVVNHSPQIKAASGLNSDSDLFSGNTGSQSPHIKDEGLFSPNSELFSGINDSRSPQAKPSNSDFFSVIIDSQGPQAKAVSGLSLNLDLFAVKSDGQGQQIKAVRGLASYPAELNSNGNFFPGEIDFDAFAFSQNQQKEADNSNNLNSNLNASTSNFNGMDTKLDGLISNSDPPIGNEEFDDDDDGWEFKDAYSELKVGDRSDMVDGMDQVNSKVPGISSEFIHGSHGSIDLFSVSNGFPDMGFDFKPQAVAQKTFVSDSFFGSEQNSVQNGFISDPVVETTDDEGFGDFLGAFGGTGLKQDEPKCTDFSHPEVKVFTSDGKVEENKKLSGNHQGALPLSIFGDEELETDDSFSIQDTFIHKPSAHMRNGSNSQGSNISIHDLLSNLYGQDEQIPSVDNFGKLPANELEFTDEVLSNGLENGDNDFDDASWEFKDALPQTEAIDETSLHSPGDAIQKISTNSNLNDHVDFYSKLKDELLFVCQCHLNGLKKAKNTVALSGEDEKVEAIEEEIQEAHKELHNLNINSEEYLMDQSPRDIHLSQFLEVLHEVQFQVLESEYHLSSRLQLAEKDFKSAIELMRHTTSMLNILTLGSIKDQHTYVCTWSKIISACAEELKHGSWIWNQSLQRNLQSSILSEPRGKSFILALGEIYRVVGVLGVSSKLYKPWILSSSVDSTSIYALLEECYSLWSSSGIEEALQCITDPIDFEYHSTVEALWDSIKYLHNLDVFALGNCAFSQQLSFCRLSLLSSEAVPDMKKVCWNGENYFFTLANLWANLISHDPPELPHLNVGS